MTMGGAVLPSRFDTADDEQQVPSINQLQGELNLARGSGGAANFSEAGSLEGVSGQPHVDYVEDVEELRAKLQIQQLDSAGAPAEWRVLDERNIEIIIGRDAESVTPESV